MTTPIHTILELCKRSDAIARDKGWLKEGDPRPFGMSIALMHSEISEALEDYRNHKGLNERYYEGTAVSIDGRKHTEYYSGLKESADVSKYKPCDIPIERADLVIRVCQRVGTDWAAEALEDFFLNGLHDFNEDFRDLLAQIHARLSDAFNSHGLDGESHLPALADTLSLTFAFCE